MTLPIAVLHYDDALVAADKPPGLAVVPASGDRLAESVRGRLERQLGVKLWVVHRLDRDTSGVLLFARTPGIHRALCLAFEERRVHKTYVAFTIGIPSPREGRIDAALHAARRGKVRPARPKEPGAWDAATHYVVRKRWERAEVSVAMVEAHPETGRHHQVRAHLRSIGAPILFDRVYGRLADSPVLGGAPVHRLALHASRLVVPDPLSPPSTRAFDAPLPADLVALLHWLDSAWTPGTVEG